VDNHSTDGSVHAVRPFPSVKIIEMGHNAGYGRAANAGFEVARGRYLMVLNPDTVMHEGSLEALVQFADTHLRAGIVAPRLLNPDGSVQVSAFRFPTLAMAFLDLFPLPSFIPGRVRLWVYRSWINGRYPTEAVATRPFRIDHPLGACMLINRRAYEQVGGFDPALFMYSEEIELALRYRKRGWECWQVPQAKVTHYGGQSTKQLPDEMFLELWRSRLYLYRKYYPRAYRVALALMLAVSQIGQILTTKLRAATGSIAPNQASRLLRRARTALRLAKTALT
jgi:GT2 family glycosyltransferase